MIDRSSEVLKFDRRVDGTNTFEGLKGRLPRRVRSRSNVVDKIFLVRDRERERGTKTKQKENKTRLNFVSDIFTIHNKNNNVDD